LPAVLLNNEMSSHALVLISGYSVLLAAVIGFLRYRKVTRDDRPFFFIVWIAGISEIMSAVLTSAMHSTSVNNNIYVLIEALLYAWLFDRWGSLSRKKNRLLVLQGFIVLVWILDNLILHRLTHTNSLFRIVSSFIMVFLAINQINQLITTERGNLMRNSRFLISAGMVIFFSYKAIIETFFWIQLPFSDTFYIYVLLIMDYVNLFVNLIFALAGLWIPTRRKFILPS
jgi:hypothetical protein